MYARFVVIAAAALMSGAALADEPAKPVAQPASAQPQHGSPQVVLASAETAPVTPPAAQQPATPPKRRIARVTTCRCGDPQAQPEQQ